MVPVAAGAVYPVPITLTPIFGPSAPSIGQSGSYLQSIRKTRKTAAMVRSAKPSSTDARTMRSVLLSRSTSSGSICVTFARVMVVWTIRAVWKEHAIPQSTARGNAILIEGPRKRRVPGIRVDGRYPPKPRLVWMLAAETKLYFLFSCVLSAVYIVQILY